MVTTVSIRLALRKLAEITCGMAPTLIRVTARSEATDRRIYTASIPWEYRYEVCSYLKAHLDFEIYLHCGLLILTEKQAEAVLQLAYDRQVEQSNAMATELEARSD
jgi:hypothetical protein